VGSEQILRLSNNSHEGTPGDSKKAALFIGLTVLRALLVKLSAWKLELYTESTI
jgi:hypothetical protein